jgi:hypothetical protein
VTQYYCEKCKKYWIDIFEQIFDIENYYDGGWTHCTIEKIPIIECPDCRGIKLK